MNNFIIYLKMDNKSNKIHNIICNDVRSKFDYRNVTKIYREIVINFNPLFTFEENIVKYKKNENKTSN